MEKLTMIVGLLCLTTGVVVSEDLSCNVPGDVVFVLDGSSSISSSNFTKLKMFVSNVIDNLEIGPGAIRVGMVVYSTRVGDTVNLQPSKTKMMLKRLAMSLSQPMFGTNTAAGIEAARNMIRNQGRAEACKVMVIITDGRSTDPKQTIIQAKMAKEAGITILAIGIGRDTSEELKQLGSGPNYVTVVHDFISLQSIINTIRNRICSALNSPTTPVSSTSRT